MNNKLSHLVIISTLLAVILGGTLGYFTPEFMLSISFIGKLFLNILKVITIPFALTMIIVGLASMGSKDKIKRSLGKTALYFSATSIVASLFGVLLAIGIQPGVGTSKGHAFIPEEIIPHLNSFSLNNLFGSFIPDNFLSASVEIQFFVVIVIALLFGTVLTNVDKKDRIVLDFFNSLKQLLSGLMKYILYMAPVGLFSLSGTLFAENWQSSELLFQSLALFSVTIIFGLSVFSLVLLPIVAKLFSNVSPYDYFRSMIPALTTAFATNSATATLPVTEECIKTTSVDERASAFVLPLGSLFNASGTALFLSASAIFIAQIYGISLSVTQIVGVVGGSFFIATLTSFIPYASLFMLALVLDIANFPIHVTAGVGLLVLADFLFGRLRSVVDVWSDAVGVAVLGNTFDFKTARSAKAAIPIKRTYNKTSTRTNRDNQKNKTEYPKTKRENKKNTQSKTTQISKSSKDSITKDTKSPFQISPKTNYLAEKEKSPTITQTAKTETKKPKSLVVKHEVKTVKAPVKQLKKVVQKTETKPVKTEQKIQDKPKPIIHKIEVPPLMARPQSIGTPSVIIEPEVKEKTVIDSPLTNKVHEILSLDTIERERAKITAQLNMMRKKETLQEVSEKIEKQSPPETTDKKADKEQEDNFTKIDFYSDDKPIPEKLSKDSSSSVEKDDIEVEPIITQKPKTKSVESTPVEPVPVIEQLTKTDKSTEEKKTKSFGRKSTKRAPVKKTTLQNEVDSPVESETVEKSEFAIDSIAFGRGKRKK